MTWVKSLLFAIVYLFIVIWMLYQQTFFSHSNKLKFCKLGLNITHLMCLGLPSSLFPFESSYELNISATFLKLEGMYV